MKKAAAPTTPLTSDKSPFSPGALGVTFLDTTWRIAVPVLGATGLGIVADLQLGTKPWLTLGAVLLGFGLAGVLIKRQLEASELSDALQSLRNSAKKGRS